MRDTIASGEFRRIFLPCHVPNERRPFALRDAFQSQDHHCPGIYVCSLIGIAECIGDGLEGHLSPK